MPVKSFAGKKLWVPKTPKRLVQELLFWGLGTTIVMYCWSVISKQTIWLFAYDAPNQAANLFQRMLPPNFGHASALWGLLLDTVNIATLGTCLALCIAVPVAFLAARNTTPHPTLRGFGLLVIVVSRSVNSLIWALMLVAVFGPGIVSGILAIALRSIGFIGKLVYEAIEEIDPEPVEAVEATGGSGGQIVGYAVLPQIMPSLTGIALYRWDINIRESTVIGLVGAGGIGLQLNAAILGLRWANVSVILLMILVLVILSEWISALLRKRLV